MTNYEANLEELFAHIRTWHRYEPTDWLGSNWDIETPRQRFMGYRKAHTTEHHKWSDHFEEDEWVIIKHPLGSRDADAPNKVLAMPILDRDGNHKLVPALILLCIESREEKEE